MQIKTDKDIKKYGLHVDLIVYQGDHDWLRRKITWLNQIARLAELAIELNDGWVPRWHDDNAAKYYVKFCPNDKQLKVDYSFWKDNNGGYFPIFCSREVAQQAIDILMSEIKDDNNAQARS